jgi:hypothetical protein
MIDILMVTYNRPYYTRLSLTRLLDTCDERMRVWVWHNGTDEETLEFVKSARDHPSLYRFHHSPANKRLREPTNWFFTNATGEYLSKVDDDNLMSYDWGKDLRAAHESDARLGVLGCWSFLEQDVVPTLAEAKVRAFGRHRVMQNCWVAGTGYLMKRRCFEEMGPLQEGQSFPQYCIQLALRGWIHGWPYPFVYMENLDDPRHPLTRLKTEEDFRVGRGLSAKQFQVRSLQELRDRQRLIALELQEASTDPRDYVGWRGRFHRAVKRFVYKRRVAQ